MARLARSLSSGHIRRRGVVTFVTVGNAHEPFSRLLNAVETLASERQLPEPILYQVGRNPGFCSKWGDARSFVPLEEFEALIAKSHLIISHAGAGTVMHALACDRRLVVMPRRAIYGEHVDEHQVEFTQALAAVGLVTAAWEPADLGPAVRACLSAGRKNRFSTQGGLARVVGECLHELVGGRRRALS